MSDQLFERVALIGIGLIGSSLARVLRRDCPDTRIVACARRAETLDAVRRLGHRRRDDRRPGRGGGRRRSRRARDAAFGLCRDRRADRAGAAAKARSSPMSARSRSAVIRDARPLLPGHVHFVPGHPVAGTEHSGPESGFAELFRDRWCILTPCPDTDPDARRQGDGAVGAGRHAGARRWRPTSRQGAGDHLASAASDRLHDRRHRDRSRRGSEIRGHRVFGRRLPRLHPHRRLRPRDVARHLPGQPRGGARDAAALQRGSDRVAARDPAGARATNARLFTRTRAIRRSIIEAKQA